MLTIRQLRAFVLSGIAAVVILAGIIGAATAGKKYLPKKVARHLPAPAEETRANSANRSNLSAVSQTATLVVGQEMYVDEARAGTTVYDMMKRAQELSTLRFKVKDSESLGAFVEEINGVANDAKENMYWVYYINDTPAQAGISSQMIKAGDRVEWKYEKAF